MTWVVGTLAAVLLTTAGASAAGEYVGSHEQRTYQVRTSSDCPWAPSPGAGLIECP